GDRFSRRIRLQSPFAKHKHRGNHAPYNDRQRTTLREFAYSAEQCRNCTGKQKHNEADSPKACDRSDLDQRQKIYLCVSEIAPRAVRRRDRVEIFAGDPVNRESERCEEERSASQEASREQNAKTKNSSGKRKKKNDRVQRQLDHMPEIIPLVHFAEEPGD